MTFSVISWYLYFISQRAKKEAAKLHLGDIFPVLSILHKRPFLFLVSSFFLKFDAFDNAQGRIFATLCVLPETRAGKPLKKRVFRPWHIRSVTALL